MSFFRQLQGGRPERSDLLFIKLLQAQNGNMVRFSDFSGGTDGGGDEPSNSAHFGHDENALFTFNSDEAALDGGAPLASRGLRGM